MGEIDYVKEINKLKEEFGDLKSAFSQPTSHQLANSRYEKKLNKFVLRIPEHEKELWNHLKSQPNMNQYIKQLIAKDIGYKTWEHFKGMVPTEEFRKDWDAEKQIKNFKSKLMQIQTWDQLNKFVTGYAMTDSEWEQVESLFDFDGEPSGLAYDLFAMDILPYDAWNKKNIRNKVNHIIENAPFEANINWDKYSEKTLKSKLLTRTNIGDPDSELNKHLNLFAINDLQMLKLFKIDFEP